MSENGIMIHYGFKNSDKEIYEKISEDEFVLKIFFANCSSKIRNELYRTYHTYRDFIGKVVP